MMVLILRGIPGSGKSTYLKNNYPNARVCSADRYFVDKDGNYKFNPENLEHAHVACFRQFLDYCQDPAMINEIVAVDNTNLTVAEISPYVQAAKAYGHAIKIVRVDCEPTKAANRNVHSVPLESVKRMASKLERLPPYYPQEIIVPR